MAKKSFIFYLEWKKALQDYPAKIRHEVYDAIVEYAYSGNVIQLSSLAKMAFSFIKHDMDENDKKYEAKIAARSEAGKRGGAPKGNQNASKNKQNKQNKQTFDLFEQNKQKQAKQAKQAVNVHDNVNELSNDNIQKEIVFTDNPEKTQEEIPKKKSSEWKKPTVEEIRAYAEEKGYTNVDAEDFWNFYESKGWMVGSNHMKKWQSSVALWNRRRHREPRNRDPMYDRIHYEGEHNPHAYDEAEEYAKWQKDNVL